MTAHRGGESGAWKRIAKNESRVEIWQVDLRLGTEDAMRMQRGDT